jgi:hypothetical protein
MLTQEILSSFREKIKYKQKIHFNFFFVVWLKGGKARNSNKFERIRQVSE